LCCCLKTFTTLQPFHVGSRMHRTPHKQDCILLSWDVAPCGRFTGTYCLHPQDRQICERRKTLAVAD
jgi:hypothetical protein